MMVATFHECMHMYGGLHSWY